MAINYKNAGVDVDAGQREVELIKSIVKKPNPRMFYHLLVDFLVYLI